MKIGLVANTAWNIYNFRVPLIRALEAQGHKVITVAPPDAFAERLEKIGITYHPIKMDAKGTNPITDLKLTHQLFRLYKRHGLEFVLHYTIKPNIYGTLAARMAGIKTINNVTGLGTTFLRDTFSSKVARLLYRFTFSFPECVFFQNDDDRQLFLKQGLVSEKKSKLIPGSGLDTRHFHTYVREPYDQTFTFLMIARVLYDKGILEYISAIRKLKQEGSRARFLLLGKINEDKGLGVSRAQIQAWEDEGLIKYLGVTDDVRPYIEQAHCVVLPSYREGTPRTLLEAASMYRPIVTTCVPGCRETVREGYNGFFCEVKNAESLKQAMHRMEQLELAERLQMGENSRCLVEEKFAMERIIQHYKEALELACPLRKQKPVMQQSSTVESHAVAFSRGR